MESFSTTMKNISVFDEILLSIMNIKWEYQQKRYLKYCLRTSDARKYALQISTLRYYNIRKRCKKRWVDRMRQED